MQKISFGNKDLGNVLARMTEREVDELPFGAIQLDALGNVLSYNQAECELSGRRAEDVLGKNFFLDVAPCTRRPEFYGAFLEGVTNKRLSTMFEYVFDHKMNPTRVRVHMTRSIMNDTYWVFVKRT